MMRYSMAATTNFLMVLWIVPLSIQARVLGHWSSSSRPWFPAFHNHHRQTPICDSDSSPQLMLAIQCNNGTQVLTCVSPNDYHLHSKTCQTGFSKARRMAIQNVCQDGGLGQVLPYYTGCYPHAQNYTFWNSYFPDMDPLLVEEESICNVPNLPVPSLNILNSDFENDDIGLSEWSTIIIESGTPIEQKQDNVPRCENFGMCLAYQGTGYAIVSAGDSLYQITEPNTLYRSDFRIPEMDSMFCQPKQQQQQSSDPMQFCFSFAMRFISKEVDIPPSISGNNDIMTVQVQRNGDDGEMLFEKTIHSTDVEGLGDNTGWDGLGDDGGWEYVQVPLPSAALGDKAYFTFRVMVSNGVSEIESAT